MGPRPTTCSTGAAGSRPQPPLRRQARHGRGTRSGDRRAALPRPPARAGPGPGPAAGALRGQPPRRPRRRRPRRRSLGEQRTFNVLRSADVSGTRRRRLRTGRRAPPATSEPTSPSSSTMRRRPRAATPRTDLDGDRQSVRRPSPPDRRECLRQRDRRERRRGGPGAAHRPGHPARGMRRRAGRGGLFFAVDLLRGPGGLERRRDLLRADARPSVRRGPGSARSSCCLAVFIHEFQHMINYGQQVIRARRRRRGHLAGRRARGACRGAGRQAGARRAVPRQRLPDPVPRAETWPTRTTISSTERCLPDRPAPASAAAHPVRGHLALRALARGSLRGRPSRSAPSSPARWCRPRGPGPPTSRPPRRRRSTA